MEKRFDGRIFSLCVLVVFGIALLGSLFTSGNIDSGWYTQNRPFFTPPNFVFGIVWPILYFLIALSLYFVWINSHSEDKKKIGWLFGVNLIANSLWSYFFFEIQNPALAFFDILIILGTLVGMIFVTKKIDKKSMWLLVPYLVWVCFAAILNLAFIL